MDSITTTPARPAASGKATKPHRPKHLFRSLALVLGMLCLASPAFSQKIEIDTASARAVLKALQDPNLGFEQAMSIAKLQGNQGMIKKMHDLGEADTEQQFAHALVAAAHGQPASSPQEKSYSFPLVKSSAPAISLLLDQIEHGIDQVVRNRIYPFVLKPDVISLRGFVVAGGDGGGYAFGGSDFFINMAYNEDMPSVLNVTMHEAFHGVQGAVYQEDTEHWAKGGTQAADKALGSFCSHVAELFVDLRSEGTAMYVGSDELLKDSKGATGIRLYGEWLYGNAHLSDSAGLLEISLASMQAPHPVSYKLVYQIDFYGKGIVYFIGSAMTKAIADENGPAAVGQVIEQPGYEFVLRYTRLKSYGKDSSHPRLGDNTVRAAQMLHDRCPPS